MIAKLRPSHRLARSLSPPPRPFVPARAWLPPPARPSSTQSRIEHMAHMPPYRHRAAIFRSPTLA